MHRGIRAHTNTHLRGEARYKLGGRTGAAVVRINGREEGRHAVLVRKRCNRTATVESDTAAASLQLPLTHEQCILNGAIHLHRVLV